MKLKKINRKKNKLMYLQILKIYYKKKSSNFEKNLNQIKIHFNKISNIIYKYHIIGKKILFLGFPMHFKKVIKNTKHILIPEFMWFNGMLNNRINKNIPLSILKLTTKLKKKIDLIVIANFSKKAEAIKESYIARIPIINDDEKLNIFSTMKTTYPAIGSSNLINKKLERDNIFFSIIKTSLNKAKKTQVYKKNLTTVFSRTKTLKLKKTYTKNKFHNNNKIKNNKNGSNKKNI